MDLRCSGQGELLYHDEKHQDIIKSELNKVWTDDKSNTSMKFKPSGHESENTRCREEGWLIRDLNVFDYIYYLVRLNICFCQ